MQAAKINRSRFSFGNFLFKNVYVLHEREAISSTDLFLNIEQTNWVKLSQERPEQNTPLLSVRLFYASEIFTVHYETLNPKLSVSFMLRFPTRVLIETLGNLSNDNDDIGWRGQVNSEVTW